MDFVRHVKHSRAKLLNSFSMAIRQLFEATIAGDQESFINLLRKNPGVLADVAVVSAETPLHIASGLGHIDIVREIISRKPGFAGELNQDGYSPLHLASSMGHLEVVRELIHVSQDLCLLKDKYGRTALHSAAMTGRLDVLKELLVASPESIMSVTARKETPLHIAVVHNQCEAVQFLVEWLVRINSSTVELINWKDRSGNTVLHLAASRKQFQTLEMLLARHPTIKAALDVSAMNAAGFTALDILNVLPSSEKVDMEIDSILRRAGALRAKDITKPVLHKFKSSRKQPSHDTIKSIQTKDTYNIMLLTATVIAAITFCAALCPPGSILKEVYKHEKQNIMPTVLFIVFNSTGFFVSVAMIIHLTTDFPMKMWMLIAMSSMAGSYTCSISVISPDIDLNLFFLATAAVLVATVVAHEVIACHGLMEQHKKTWIRNKW